MKKLQQLEQLVSEGTENEKVDLTFHWVKEYILGLNRLLRWRAVDRDILDTDIKEYFFPEVFADERVKKLTPTQRRVFTLNVFDVVRHIWEFTNESGEARSGDDLRKAHPGYFPDDESKSVLDIYQKMLHM